jgi:hypothetical protein
VEASFTWPVVAARTAALYDDVIRQTMRIDRLGYERLDAPAADDAGAAAD